MVKIKRKNGNSAVFSVHFCYHGVILLKQSLKKLIAVVVGIVLNISGRLIAQAFGLPIWLDMTGTFVAADIAGFPGALIAALSANIFFGAPSPTRLVYCFVGIIAAALITYFVKKGYLLNPLKAALASFWLGIICTIAFRCPARDL